MMSASDQGSGQQRWPGVTSPISTSPPTPADNVQSQKLEACLRSFGLFESDEEMAHRMNVLSQVNELVQKWILSISLEKGIPQSVAEGMSGKIFTFGSFRLGVHTKGADIDTLLVVPRHLERTDFFLSFSKTLEDLPQVEYIHVVEDAFVPLIKTKVDGIELDILFARLALKTIAKDQDLKSVELLRNLESKCVRSLNGCRVTDDILSLVPNHSSFRLALRAIKLWAKKRGIYSNALGYLGGVSWAMLVARICQLYPNAAAATLVQKFFTVWCKWEWPKPVLLRNHSEDFGNLGYPVWDPRSNPSDRYHLMPIITPSYPQQNSTFNVTQSTKTVMTNEFTLGGQVCERIYQNKADWNELFEPFNIFANYKHFIALIASSQAEWVGLVESKIRLLVQSLEKHRCIKVAHVNPGAYTRNIPAAEPLSEDSTEQKADEKTEETETEAMWFIGLEFDKSELVNIDLTTDIQNFTDTVRKQAVNSLKFKEEMRIEAQHVKKKDLTRFLPIEIIKKGSKTPSKGRKDSIVLEAELTKSQESNGTSTPSKRSSDSGGDSDSSAKRMKTVDNVNGQEHISKGELAQSSPQVATV
ncbi:Poly(A) polymerase gamma [Halotydeus destructor]|nr:Poly(A) polymerase gamma [Halotydeus destructor]